MAYFVVLYFLRPLLIIITPGKVAIWISFLSVYGEHLSFRFLVELSPVVWCERAWFPYLMAGQLVMIIYSSPAALSKSASRQNQCRHSNVRWLQRVWFLTRWTFDLVARIAGGTGSKLTERSKCFCVSTSSRYSVLFKYSNCYTN